MRFSLIIATKGRTTEVGAFLASLRRQNTADFEVIIVDQNDDDRLGAVMAPYEGEFSIRWLRSSIANSSHARNLGIAAAQGEIIAFPDDDCLYPEGLLQDVDQHFIADPSLGLLVGPSRAPGGGLGSGRWTAYSCRPGYRDIWTCVIEFNMFLRLAALPPHVRFDEDLGVGARFGSGEGTDLAITVMKQGAVVFYDFDLYVVHPDKALSEVAVQRAFRYGTGFGRVLRKHFDVMPKFTVLSYFIRPFGGIVLSLLRARSLHARYYYQTLRGRLSGMLANVADTPAARSGSGEVPAGQS